MASLIPLNNTPSLLHLENVYSVNAQGAHEVSVFKNPHKTYSLTVNNDAPADAEIILATPDVNKITVGNEGCRLPVPHVHTSICKTPHLQCAITFLKAIRFNAVLKLFRDKGIKGHLEIGRLANSLHKYCEKEGDFKRVDNTNQGKRSDQERFNADVNDGVMGPVELWDEHTSLMNRQGRNVSKFSPSVGTTKY